jgi:mannose-6-phosphate isomerase-like protein (cupin superfamily)
MEVIKCWEEEGQTISEPYKRHIKVMLAPDTRNVPEITFSHAIIYPHSKTDYHAHDRPELILIVSGRGISVCDGKEIPIEPDMALWVKAGEMHQVINTGEESIKLATVFVPGYTAKENLDRIVQAAEKAKSEGKE